MIEIRRVFTEVLMNSVWAILIVLKFRRFHTSFPLSNARVGTFILQRTT